MIPSHFDACADPVPVADRSFFPRRAPVAWSFSSRNATKRCNWSLAGSRTAQEQPTAQNFFRSLLFEVSIKVCDAVSHGARSHEEIQTLFEYQHPRSSTSDLMGEILAQRSFGCNRIVGFANLR